MFWESLSSVHCVTSVLRNELLPFRLKRVKRKQFAPRQHGEYVCPTVHCSIITIRWNVTAVLTMDIKRQSGF